MMSQHGTKILRCWENSFINKYLTLKLLLFLIFLFLSPLVHVIQTWVLSRTYFGLMTSPRWPKSSKFSENCFINKQFTCYKHWYMKYQFGPFWPIFGLMTSPHRESICVTESHKIIGIFMFSERMNFNYPSLLLPPPPHSPWFFLDNLKLVSSSFPKNMDITN